MKTGLKTTEFWSMAVTNIIAGIIGILAARGLLSPDEGELWLSLAQSVVVVVVPLVIAYTTGKYNDGRVAQKVAGTEAQAAVQVAHSEAQAAVQMGRQ